MKIIIGIGSHSQVIYSIFNSLSYEVKFVSYPSICEIDNLNHIIKNNYIGGIDEIYKEINNEYIIGIGNNELRKDIYLKYPFLNYINAVHPKATIFNNVKIGIGNVICPGVIIQTDTVIGNHNIINTNTSIDHHNIIHDFIHIAPNCAVCGNVTIYDNVFIGVGSSIVNKIKIKPYSFIKANNLIKHSTGPIQIYKPNLDNYKSSALDAINSGWISYLGKYINLTINKLKDICKIKNVILVSNGTCATHCLFIALKYKYPMIKKIYIPNNCYVAVWNCALMEYKESQLEVMKMNIDTWNVDLKEDYIKSLDKNSAIIIVHNLGNIIDVDYIKHIRPDIILIEDNCEGVFGKYNNIYSGTSKSTLCSSISFFGNKIITSGEGGAIFTNDDDVYNYLARKCNQGITEKKYIHDILAYNYRMTNIEAAFLYDQLIDIDNILNIKKNIFRNYTSLFQDMIDNKKIYVQKVDSNTIRSNWIYAIRIVNNNSFENVEKFLSEYGIDIRPMFYPIEFHEHFKNFKNKDDDIPYILARECFMIPSSPDLTYNEQKYICEKIIKYINNL